MQQPAPKGSSQTQQTPMPWLLPPCCSSLYWGSYYGLYMTIIAIIFDGYIVGAVPDLCLLAIWMIARIQGRGFLCSLHTFAGGKLSDVQPSFNKCLACDARAHPVERIAARTEEHSSTLCCSNLRERSGSSPSIMHRSSHHGCDPQC